MPGPEPESRPRVTEWILGAYFAYTAALALLLPLEVTVRVQAICASAAALAILHCLARFPLRSVPALLRNTFPILIPCIQD